MSSQNNKLIQFQPLFQNKYKNINSLENWYKQITQEENVILLSVFGIKSQSLKLIMQTNFVEKEDDERTIYISDKININSSILRVIYFSTKENKVSKSADYQIYDCLADIFKQLSTIIISDVNFHNFRKLGIKKTNIKSKQYVVVNGRDLYGVGIKESNLQLLNKLEVRNPTNLIHKQFFYLKQQSISDCRCSENLTRDENTNCLIDCKNSANLAKTINLKLLENIINTFLQEYTFLIKKQNCFVASSYITIQYLLEEYILKYSQNYKLVLGGQKMLKSAQILQIQNILSEKAKQFNNSNQEFSIVKIILKEMIKRLKQKNKNNSWPLFKQIINQASAIQSNQSNFFTSNYQTYIQQYQTQQLERNFVSKLVQNKFLQQKNISLEQTNLNILRQLSSLKSLLTEKQLIIQSYENQINDYSRKILQSKNTIQFLKIKESEFDELKSHNRMLTLKLQSCQFIEKRSDDIRHEQQNSIRKLQKQNQQLINQLNIHKQQIITLNHQNMNLTEQNKSLQDRIEQYMHIEMRGLRSIENQAEIKVRLNRYENYMRQLKSSISAFKKIQIQKFNRILEYNYQEFQKVSQEALSRQAQLQKVKKKNRQLMDSLQIEKIRINYFEKVVRGKLQIPILQVPEQNDTTDRIV